MKHLTPKQRGKKNTPRAATTADLEVFGDKLLERIDKRFATMETRMDVKFATKEDLKGFATKEDLDKGFRKLHEEMDVRFKKVHEDIDTVLDVVVSIDQRLTPKIDSHERRLTKLERHTGLAAKA